MHWLKALFKIKYPKQIQKNNLCCLAAENFVKLNPLETYLIAKSARGKLFRNNFNKVTIYKDWSRINVIIGHDLGYASSLATVMSPANRKCKMSSRRLLYAHPLPVQRLNQILNAAVNIFRDITFLCRAPLHNTIIIIRLRLLDESHEILPIAYVYVIRP